MRKTDEKFTVVELLLSTKTCNSIEDTLFDVLRFERMRGIGYRGIVRHDTQQWSSLIARRTN